MSLSRVSITGMLAWKLLDKLLTEQPNPASDAIDRMATEEALRVMNAEDQKVAVAVDRNNSDVDFCEFRGRTVITYSWGNQQGTEFLAEAVYDGTLASFLKGFFP